jgi:hypothetical protein
LQVTLLSARFSPHEAWETQPKVSLWRIHFSKNPDVSLT